MSPEEAMDDEVEIGAAIEYPPGWVDLFPGIEACDPRAWAREHVLSQHPDALTARLDYTTDQLTTAVAATGDTPWVFLAAAYQPHPLGPVLVTWDVQLIPFDPQGPMSLEEIEQNLGAGGATVATPERSRCQLPCGPAVRLRRLQHEHGWVDAHGFTLLSEGIAYAILPPRLGGYAIVSGRWSALARGDELAAHVDDLAQRLEIIVE